MELHWNLRNVVTGRMHKNDCLSKVTAIHIYFGDKSVSISELLFYFWIMASFSLCILYFIVFYYIGIYRGILYFYKY